jgi:site-specific recombinase XerD
LGSTDDLIPTAPAEGIEIYLDKRSSDIRKQTETEYRRKLQIFVDFLDDRGIENLNDLNGRTIYEYQIYRRDESSDEVDTLSKKTLRDDLYLLRDCLETLENIEAVPDGLHSSFDIPTLTAEEATVDEVLREDRITEILSHLRDFEYATREHVTIEVLWETGCRLGGLRALDVSDCHLERDDPYLSFRDRPETETPLKNDEKGERDTNISASVAEILLDYIENCRTEKTDEFGREPLISTNYGRASKPTIRRYLYKWSRPCQVTGNCPKGRDIEECIATGDKDDFSKCPDSRSPHAVRRGYLSERLNDGVPTRILSGRCDVSQEVLDKHYDKRSEEEKRELRRKMLRESLGEDSDGGSVDGGQYA